MPAPDRSASARARRAVRDAFTEHLPYKAAALFLALVLWFVTGSEEPAEDRVAVRFAPQLDTTLTLLERPQVTALVVGSKGDLLKLYGNPPTIRRIFGADTPDTVRIELSPADVQLPPGVNADVRAVVPANVTLRFTQRLEKLVPVRSRLRVNADSGLLLLGEPTFAPDSVIVSGDGERLAAITSVPTQRGDVLLRDTLPVVVPLDTSGLGARVRPMEVRLYAPVVRDTLIPIPGLLPWNAP
ncbi:MAG TPA: hypothetical protein VFY16_14380 [Gemmatimonadaceae bacterium]|nr:hypothetical protein [Gemmatimonadaceae bacterium]